VTQPLVGYQYVVLRCVPRVDRDEFVNVGVVLFCEGADFLDCAFALDRDRLGAFSPDLDLGSVDAALETIAATCRGAQAAGHLSMAELGRRFGWLAAPRSTVVQPGPVHGGLTDAPARELERILALVVG
jgi:hypothetical protein